MNNQKSYRTLSLLTQQQNMVRFAQVTALIAASIFSTEMQVQAASADAQPKLTFKESYRDVLVTYREDGETWRDVYEKSLTTSTLTLPAGTVDISALTTNSPVEIYLGADTAVVGVVSDDTNWVQGAKSLTLPVWGDNEDGTQSRMGEIKLSEKKDGSVVMKIRLLDQPAYALDMAGEEGAFNEAEAFEASFNVGDYYGLFIVDAIGQAGIREVSFPDGDEWELYNVSLRGKCTLETDTFSPMMNSQKQHRQIQHSFKMARK